MDPIDLVRQEKIKRYFRATRKLNTPNLISHITQRAAGKEPLFLEDSDYLFMLWLMKETSQNYSLTMYAFCLMPNHIHILLSPSRKNLSDAMRDLFARYAMQFNRKYERKGHLFGGPYRQAVCIDDSYLLAASLYIHLNPVKAGLARNPEDYRWSSIRLYYDNDTPKSFINSHFILGLLSDDQLRRNEQYQLLLKKGSELNARLVLEQKDAIERFRLKLASIFPSAFKHADKKRKVARYLSPNLISLEELERHIEAVKNMRFPNRPESRKAKKYLVEQLIARGYKRSEVAELLGVSRKTVYNIIKVPL
jgi:putative transposase